MIERLRRLRSARRQWEYKGRNAYVNGFVTYAVRSPVVVGLAVGLLLGRITKSVIG